MTNETLKEAAEKLFPACGKHLRIIAQKGFIEGVKWQAERSYSKEEVNDLLDRLLEGNMCSVAGEELIEKFKKA